MLLRGALSIRVVVIVACMVSTATIVLAEPVIFQVGTQQTMPFGINNLGQVVGWFGNNNGDDHGFLRNPDGTISTIDALGSSVLYTRLFGINDSGVMVGYYREAQEFGLMISAQGFFRVNPLGSVSTSVHGINSSGDIVGTFRTDSSGLHGFIQTDALKAGARTTFDAPGAQDTQPYGINDAGMVVGRFVDAARFAHAFLRDSNGQFTILAGPHGERITANGINNHGQIVGSLFDAGTHGFVREPDGRFTVFDLAGCSSVSPSGINDSGQIVGRCGLANGLDRGFIATSSDFIPTPGQADEWRFCATEGGFCSFSGTMQVRYGANDSFSFQTLIDGTACTNATFGDPAPNTPKQCAIRIASGPSPPGDWVFCATEGGFCAFTGTMEVRYGANDSFVVKVLTDGTACTNAAFGDPAPDTAKHCAIQPPSTPPPPGDWTFCTTEGGFCAFSGTMPVRYGANGLFVVKTLTDGTACTNEVFGDPAPDVAKSCSLPLTGP